MAGRIVLSRWSRHDQPSAAWSVHWLGEQVQKLAVHRWLLAMAVIVVPGGKP